MPSSRNTLNRSSLPSKSSHLIVGFMGEVGRALMEILDQHYKVAGIDVNNNSRGIKDIQDDRFDVLHICIPFKQKDIFEAQVKRYQIQFKPKVTVIHSTVPVGTCRRLKAVHSPIRGRHPNLKEGMMVFPKFLGGENASLVADLFRRAGMKVILCDKSETTEAGKLFDTEYYRVCIEFAQRVKAYCDKYKLNFHEVYTLFNQTYNEGYIKLGMPEVVRPVLQPIMTPIGGHCIMPNKELIND